MEDELELFIRERKARLAQDRASLEHDPPYMEIQEKPHRSYGSLLKENIPPGLTAQKKVESSNVGLPLGVEYQKKKDRLQHELRMDYRNYIAQQAGVLRQHPLSRRDVGTLTEVRKESCSGLSPPESPIHQVSRRETTPVDQELEEEQYTELRSSRRMGLDSSYKKPQPKKVHGREERDSPSGFVDQGRRSRALIKADDAEFSTSLLIGEIHTDETLQRRKERYREELQEQIAEQHRNKQREKDLELKVAATGVNDPEKQPNRIRQFGLSKRKESQLSRHSMLGQSESSSSFPNHDKTSVNGRLMAPRDLPHGAFQSPLIECHGDGPTPDRLPVGRPFPRAMGASRIPFPPLHSAHAGNEAFSGPYPEPHYYYNNNRNLPDPNFAYYGHLPYPAMGLPLIYYNMSPGGDGPSQLGDASSQSGSSFPESSPLPNTETITTGPHTGLMLPERSRSTREKTLDYAESLKKQIQEQQERKRVEREERERYDAKIEADMKRHQPWGRGGGGAPLKDSTGNLIADLKQMHKLNVEPCSNPKQQQRAPAVTATFPVEHSNPNISISGHKLIEDAHTNLEQQQDAPVVLAAGPAENPNDKISGFNNVQTPQIAPGTVSKAEEQEYKAYLKKQIEEKLQKQAEERERNRLEDEKLERKVAEDMARIKREYEEEQEKQKQKALLKEKAREQKDIEAKKKKTEEREKAAQKKREQEKLAQVKRELSTPVPTLQKSPQSPVVETRHSSPPRSEKSLLGRQSPPVPACRNQQRAAGVYTQRVNKRDVYSELSALRRQLRAEQKRLENHLHHSGCDEMDSGMMGRHARPQVDVFNMAMLRLQAPVRKPHSRNMEPSNLLQIHDSLQLHTDRESSLSSVDIERMERVGVASRRRQVYNYPHQKPSSQRSTCTNDCFDVYPTHQNDRESVIGRHARGSLLDSDSAFLAPLGDVFPVPSSPEPEETPLTARERRRLTKQSEYSLEPLENPANSGSRKRREAESSSEEKSQEKMSPCRAANTAGTVDLSDDDPLLPQISHLNRKHQSSIESFSTDPWMRPGTSETLKFLEGSPKSDHLTS
ncbi:centrosome and spindle pole associated protein 1-like isoform X1 [Syngnathus typhle]|uniref:centrosome and spindle pole associated protein 1-like isoform X1 n=1 Tax=Syngnathus typhle TaxID=161592 RepID=UPI002A6A5C60|nr:centrosome and spindle pole associated protein 1-like isoform X1 [Syngnathus typhle]XP_061143142.1 centrosome and spindle pole associated protein 1-like isoform X1 [Syngnathus typhle]